jgi:Skp family chaperone for outer membrane proteins
MKKLILLTGMLLSLFSTPLFAQPAAGQDLEAIRVGYITKKLSLTPDEAKVFWPVYDAYRAEMKEVRGDMRETAQSAREDFDVMTDAQVEAAVNKMLDNRRKELDITLRYHEQFKKVLNIRKIAKLYKAEHEFTQIILQRLQERQNGGGAPGGPGGGRPGGGRPGGGGRF